MQQNPKNQQKANELQFYKEQVIKLKVKLADYERKLKLYEKSKQRVNQLQKTNSQNTTRLLQCVSNVRDLLHSNKNLRKQLQRQKVLRQQCQNKIISLKKQIQLFFKNQSTKKIIQDSSQQHKGTLRTKNRNIHRMNKLQKLSRLRMSTKRYSTEDFQLLQFSPCKSTNRKLNQLGRIYQTPTYNVREGVNGSVGKNKKLSKSVDLKIQEKNYAKAQIRRKQTIKDSEDKQQTLQFRPLDQENL